MSSQTGHAAEFKQIFQSEDDFHEETEDGPCAARFSGVIGSADAEKIGIGGNASSGATLCLDSPGGSLGVATKLGVDRGWKTRVLPGEHCESACAIAFLRGAYTTGNGIPGVYHEGAIWAGAKLGFHSPSIDLPDTAQVDRKAVEDAFEFAFSAAAEVNTLHQSTFSDGKPVMNPYLFQRFLETPPDEMYYIDTVGDALLANIKVFGVDATVDVTPNVAQTLCENALMVSGGFEPMITSPGRDPNRSARRVFEKFTADNEEFNKTGYGAESGGFKVRIIEMGEDGILAVAGHYPSGDYRYFRQCYVQFEGSRYRPRNSWGTEGSTIDVWLDSDYRMPESRQTILERWDYVRKTTPVELPDLAVFPFQARHADLPKTDLYKRYFLNGEDASSRPAMQASVKPQPTREPAPLSLIEHLGRDVAGGDLRHLAVADGNECRKTCEDEDACNTATYDRWNRLCFLKNVGEGSELRLNAKATTYLRADLELPESRDRKDVLKRNNRIFPARPDETVRATDYEGCADICLSKGWCLGFNYRPRSGGSDSSCEMYSEPPEYVPTQEPSRDIGYVVQP
ncbi:PAN domain-containing protein [Jiella marina]|uniref:PAN domain-containing protein n=1 Tax=Jiella sp. LLJ827 TaxID=2917712 RepID=UPI0021018775|nr:PAN domain-containing protein [Jiella sp. LLJ827]MCQ0988349.1 PAN domain-containing protein [Jiella sp. LLJ827]